MRPVLTAFLAAIILLSPACSTHTSDNGDRFVDTDYDFEILPYQLVESHKTDRPMYPVLLGPDYGLGVYEVQQGGNSGLMTPIIFGVYPSEAGDRFRQCNIPARRINSHVAFDFDSDSVQEVAISYVLRDTVWVEVLDAYEDSLYKGDLFSGKDISGDSLWDGNGWVVVAPDLNADGYRELLVVCHTGHDRTPRGLICLDWYRDTVLWFCEVAGHIQPDHVSLFNDPSTGQHCIVCGVNSPKNGVQCNGMVDWLPYVICVDANSGEILWRDVTGEGFCSPYPMVVYNENAAVDGVNAFHSVKLPNGTVHSMMKSYNLDGSVRDSLIFSKQFDTPRYIDIDGNGVREILISFKDKSLGIFDQHLNLVKSYVFPQRITPVGIIDVVPGIEKEIMAGMGDGSFWLFTTDFEPLAAIEKGGTPLLLPSAPGIPVLQLSGANGNRFMHVVKTPWYRIFSRYPLLAFLVGSIPFGAIAAGIWLIAVKFRQKNKMISAQRDKLDATLDELRAAQEELVKSEKYRQAKDIAGGFAHEIRNALFPVRGAVTRLKKGKAGQPLEAGQIADYSRIIEDSVSKAVDLTELISRYTKLEATFVPEPVNLKEAIETLSGAHRVYLEEHWIECKIDGDPEIAVESNRQQFAMVLNNLLQNSLDALTGVNHKGIIEIKWFAEAGWVYLTFTDNGCGIDPKIMDRVFDTFFSTKPDKGTGIGLSIAQKIIESSGGRIEILSKPGEGTTVQVQMKPSSN